MDHEVLCDDALLAFNANVLGSLADAMMIPSPLPPEVLNHPTAPAWLTQSRTWLKCEIALSEFPLCPLAGPPGRRRGAGGRISRASECERVIDSVSE